MNLAHSITKGGDAENVVESRENCLVAIRENR